MNCDWRNDVRMECFAHAEFVPPAMFGEAAWDCLLALHANDRPQLTLDQLARLTSLPAPTLHHRLVELERRQLVAGEMYPDGEVRAVLTRSGRELLETYLSATSRLQAGHGESPRLAWRSGPGPITN